MTDKEVFMAEIFSEGVLNIDPETHLAGQVEGWQNSLFGQRGRLAKEVARRAGILEQLVGSEIELSAWLKHFNGKVPQGWINPTRPSSDVQKAGREGVQ